MFECSVVSQACSLSVLSHHTHPTNCPPPHTHTLPGHDKHHSPTAPDGDDEHHSSRGPWVCAREPRAGIPTQLVSYSHPHPLPPNVQSGDSDSDSGASDSDSTSSLADPCSGCEGTRCGGLRCDDLGTISSAASSSSMQAPRSHDGFQHTVKVGMKNRADAVFDPECKLSTDVVGFGAGCSLLKLQDQGASVFYLDVHFGGPGGLYPKLMVWPDGAASRVFEATDFSELPTTTRGTLHHRSSTYVLFSCPKIVRQKT